MFISNGYGKAFDTIKWKFLFKALLKWFNFEDSFLIWIQVLYTDFKACVIKNDYTTNYFQLQKGVKQGDSIPPYLFIMANEV